MAHLGIGITTFNLPSAMEYDINKLRLHNNKVYGIYNTINGTQ